MIKFFVKTLFSLVVPLLLVYFFVSGTVKIYLPLQYKIPVAGTGSMYPTFPKGDEKNAKNLGDQIAAYAFMAVFPSGIKFNDREFFYYKIQRGDIVSFNNEKVKDITREIYGEESGYIKRVIGLPGEKLLIKNGLVYINGEPLEEPYTALPHSTFGGKFITECKEVEIPENSFIVLGDNRKGSSDSRHDVGYINLSDIDYVMKLNEQKGSLDQNWRDTSLDLREDSKIKLDGRKFLELLNVEREKNGLSKLIYEPKLELAAGKRAANILKYNDFSFEAEKSGYTMKRAMADSGYDSVLVGEVPLQGYYQAEELIENIFEFHESKKFVLNGDFDDFGVSYFEGEIEGCPTQVIVLHFAGFVPPNYTIEVVESWKELLNSLLNIRPEWIELKTYEGFYKENRKEIDRINEIIDYRIKHVRTIVNKMENNTWLNDENKKFMDENSFLNEEQNKLTQKINEAITNQ